MQPDNPVADDVLHLRAANLDGVGGVRHGFFGRPGGVSGGIFHSLNCGLGSGDDPAHVRENRARVAVRLEVAAAHLVTAYQVHGTQALQVRAPWPAESRPRADALATDQPGIALGVLTADCAPVLAADAEAGVIGAAHAGWRGALAGVTESMLVAMEALGARRERVRAAIGPCIAQAHYEVGPELVQAFLAADPAYEAFFAPGRRPGRQHLDLPGFVRGRLVQAGLRSIAMLSRCTYTDSENFFSYRRATHCGEPDYGRALSAIALAPGPGVA